MGAVQESGILNSDGSIFLTDCVADPLISLSFGFIDYKIQTGKIKSIKDIKGNFTD